MPTSIDMTPSQLRNSLVGSLLRTPSGQLIFIAFVVQKSQYIQGGLSPRLGCTRSAALFLLFLILSACQVLPNAGPSRSALLNGIKDKDGNVQIIELDEAIARSMQSSSAPIIPKSFLSKGLVDLTEVKPGDNLSIVVWENMSKGIFTKDDSPAATLNSNSIPETGEFFVPYAGIVNSSGKTAEEIRQEITTKLSAITPEPQVQVQHRTNSVSGVTIFGETHAQGIFPFNSRNRTLKTMLAEAGVLSEQTGVLKKVYLNRGNDTAEFFLQDLMDSDKYDVPLRPDDKITIENDKRFFRVFGDGIAPRRVDFKLKKVSALDALIMDKALDPNKSKSSGIVIIRDKNRSFGEEIYSGNSPDRTAYLLDLRKPQGIWIADMFEMQSGDIIYIPQAPIVSWMKPLTAITSTIRQAQRDVGTVQNIDSPPPRKRSRK